VSQRQPSNRSLSDSLPTFSHPIYIQTQRTLSWALLDLATQSLLIVENRGTRGSGIAALLNLMMVLAESFVKKSALQNQSSSDFWARDVENDARSSEGVLPFMGTNEKGRNVVFKHTVFTVVETRDRRQSEASTLGGNEKSSIDSGEDLSNRSVMKFASP
jgi:hypothetical protein